MSNQITKQFRFRSAIALSLALAAGISAKAQDETDALRFSTIQPQGTARSIGFGSALGSVGGDFSSLSVNPAGIGIYRRNELTFSPSLLFGSSSSEYTGVTSRDNGARFAISNLGLVTAKTRNGRRAQRGGWTSSGFGIGITRVADFTRTSYYEGRNTNSSVSYVFENDANTNGVAPPDEAYTTGDLAYKSFLLDTLNGGFISTVYPNENSPIGQTFASKERGGISELGITFGGSYQDQLMLGATVGIPILRYRRTKTTAEYDLSGNPNNDFDNFQFNDELRTNGTGLNLKIGAIYKPVDQFRFGLAIHTPTWYSLTDIYNMSLTANTEDYGYFYTGSSVNSTQAFENQYEYNMTTPWRAVASATVLFGTAGFWSVDYEFVDYSSARFGFGPSMQDQQYERAINQVIKTFYGPSSNIRTGVELRADNFFFRGGFGYYGNPYKSGTYGGRILPNANRLDFSAGLGIRFANTFIDLAFVHRRYQDNEKPYTLPDTDIQGTAYFGMIAPTATINAVQNNAVMTFGVKF